MEMILDALRIKNVGQESRNRKSIRIKNALDVLMVKTANTAFHA